MPHKNRVLVPLVINSIPKNLRKNIILSTDDEEIIKKSIKEGVIIRERPHELATDTASLKDYIQRNGFDWTYAVAPAEVSREIGNLYGNQFLNPPSTPMLIIDKQGQVHPLPFGIKSADELVEFLQPFLDES